MKGRSIGLAEAKTSSESAECGVDNPRPQHRQHRLPRPARFPWHSALSNNSFTPPKHPQHQPDNASQTGGQHTSPDKNINQKVSFKRAELLYNATCRYCKSKLVKKKIMLTSHYIHIRAQSNVCNGKLFHI